MAKNSFMVLINYSSKFLVLSLITLSTTSALKAQISDFEATDFSKADSMASLYPKHSLSDLKVLSEKLTTGLPTQVEQFRALYKWVCLNISNDYPYFLKNQRKRKRYQDQPEKLKEWNEEFSPKVIARLMKKHSTVCTGYAALIRELSYFAGIEAVIVNGYGKTASSGELAAGRPNHSWNAVKLGGKWYLCDATWSAGTIYTDHRGFQFDYSEAYFLPDPELFALNHYPMEKQWLLSDTTLLLDDFIQAPVVYKTTIEKGIKPILPKSFKQEHPAAGNMTFQLKMVNEKHSTNEIHFEIVKDGKKKMILKTLNSLGNRVYQVNHSFKNSGNYLVHMLMDGEYVVCYKVLVQ